MNDFKTKSNETLLNKAFNISLKFLSYKARTIKEMENYLCKKKFNPQIITQIIKKLENYNYLNDKDYTFLYIKNRILHHPRSCFALKYELSAKGIKENIINDALLDIDDFESAYTAIKKRVHLWEKLDKETLKKKIMNYLKNRGFNFEVSISTYNKLTEEWKNEN